MGRHLQPSPTVVVPAHLAALVWRPLAADLEQLRRAGVLVDEDLFELVMDLRELGRWHDEDSEFRSSSDVGSDVGTSLANGVAGRGSWVSTTEAASRLGVTDRWVRRLLDDDRLRGRWVGGSRIVEAQSIDEYRKARSA